MWFGEEASLPGFLCTMGCTKHAATRRLPASGSISGSTIGTATRQSRRLSHARRPTRRAIIQSPKVQILQRGPSILGCFNNDFSNAASNLALHLSVERPSSKNPPPQHPARRAGHSITMGISYWPDSDEEDYAPVAPPPKFTGPKIGGAKVIVDPATVPRADATASDSSRSSDDSTGQEVPPPVAAAADAAMAVGVATAMTETTGDAATLSVVESSSAASDVVGATTTTVTAAAAPARRSPRFTTMTSTTSSTSTSSSSGASTTGGDSGVDVSSGRKGKKKWARRREMMASWLRREDEA